MVTDKNRLTIIKPNISIDWNYDKNINKKPEDYSYGTQKVVWWKCHICKNEWSSTIYQRTNHDSGCPYCNKKRVCNETSLQTLRPDIAKDWNKEKNNLMPSDVMSKSNKKAWWVCSKGHEWESTISNRTALNRGCPYCTNQKINNENSLVTINPTLSLEWHPIKNGDLIPSQVSGGSDKKIWWICKNNNKHIWKATIHSRNKKNTGCPHCYSRTSLLELRIYTELKHFFKSSKHRYIIFNQECDVFIENLKLGIEYDGIYYHSITNKEKKDLIKNNILTQNNINLLRVRDYGMQKISKNDIIIDKKYEIVDVVISILGYITSNYNLSNAIFKKIEQYKKNRQLINEKLFIQLQDLLVGNADPGKSFGDLYSHLLLEWNYDKNGTLNPQKLSPYSNKYVWWKCYKNHIWLDSIAHRADKKVNRNCPYCSNHRICKDNCLQTKYPELAKEWHPIKNRELKPTDIMGGSGKKVWWLCANNHCWQDSPNHRTNKRNKRNCSICKKEKKIIFT